MNIMNTEEQKKIKLWNNTSCPYEENVCIHEKLEEQSKKTPNRIALSFKSRNFTYKELNDASNAMANLLLQKKIAIEDNVIIHLERSIELFICIFGILKAGGVYIPITPNYPSLRIKHIISESNPKFIITSKRFIQNYDSSDPELILVDDFINQYQALDIETPIINIKSKNLAYTIYTSGTTGKPKGVQIEHHSVLNRIGWMQKKYPLNEYDILLQKTPITFDVSIWELFWWAFAGARLVILPDGEEKKPLQLIKYIEEYNISVIHFVPSMFNVFIDIIGEHEKIEQINSLKWIFCSGEKLEGTSVNQLYQITSTYPNSTSIVNLYGPTEATVDVTFYECKKNKHHGNIPIGRPIDNTEIYILDVKNNILASGEEGELVICGANLARGYLNQQELTNEKFIDLNVFGQIKKAYKTGDKAYFNEEGNIIFKGRIDSQIKLRGNRIELGEIENTINEFNDVSSCVCLLNNKQESSAHIVAFVIPESNKIIDESDLNKYIKKWLPDYMIPSRIISIKVFPVTEHGKLDKENLLKQCEIEQTSIEFSESQIEKTLQNIWGKLFSKKNISSEINFFDIGGNSIVLIQLVSAINDKLEIDLDIIKVFEFPTISLLSKHIREIIKEDN